MNELELQKQYESILIAQRGYISKLPENKKGVFLFSGGLDSIITSARLIEDFDMELFPLFIRRGQQNLRAEEKSLIFFTNFFHKKYKDKFHSPMIINLNIPPIEFKPLLYRYSKVLDKGHPLRNTIINLVGVQYAVALSELTGYNIKTIFNGAINCELLYQHSKISSMRANTISACQNLNDWSWVITSINTDPEITNNFFGKKEEIIWAYQHNIPIEESMTCWTPVNINGVETHCGKCSVCLERKQAFLDANIPDLTKYAE